MHTITLDFSNCKYINDIHVVLKNTFEFPDYYGMNLDALWDSLKDYSIDYNHSFAIYLKGLNTKNSELHDYMLQVLELFADLHKEEPDVIFRVLS